VRKIVPNLSLVLWAGDYFCQIVPHFVEAFREVVDIDLYTRETIFIFIDAEFSITIYTDMVSMSGDIFMMDIMPFVDMPDRPNTM